MLNLILQSSKVDMNSCDGFFIFTWFLIATKSSIQSGIQVREKKKVPPYSGNSLPSTFETMFQKDFIYETFGNENIF